MNTRGCRGRESGLQRDRRAPALRSGRFPAPPDGRVDDEIPHDHERHEHHRRQVERDGAQAPWPRAGAPATAPARRRRRGRTPGRTSRPVTGTATGDAPPRSRTTGTRRSPSSRQPNAIHCHATWRRAAPRRSWPACHASRSPRSRYRESVRGHSPRSGRPTSAAPSMQRRSPRRRRVPRRHNVVARARTRPAGTETAVLTAVPTCPAPSFLPLARALPRDSSAPTAAAPSNRPVARSAEASAITVIPPGDLSCDTATPPRPASRAVAAPRQRGVPVPMTATTATTANKRRTTRATRSQRGRRAASWGDWALDSRTRRVGKAGVVAARQALEQAVARGGIVENQQQAS